MASEEFHLDDTNRKNADFDTLVQDGVLVKSLESDSVSYVFGGPRGASASSRPGVVLLSAEEFASEHINRKENWDTLSGCDHEEEFEERLDVIE